MAKKKSYHMTKIEENVYNQIVERGRYAETFSDILRRLLDIH